MPGGVVLYGELAEMDKSPMLSAFYPVRPQQLFNSPAFRCVSTVRGLFFSAFRSFAE